MCSHLITAFILNPASIKVDLITVIKYSIQYVILENDLEHLFILQNFDMK